MAGEYKSDIVYFIDKMVYSGIPSEPSEVPSESSFVFRIPLICQKCGRCCENGWPGGNYTQGMIDHLGISEDEMRDMMRHTPSPEVEELNQRFEESTLRDYTEWLPCPFLKNNLCSIYPVRPDCCKITCDTSDERECPARGRLEEISNCMEKQWWYPVFFGEEEGSYGKYKPPDISLLDYIKMDDFDPEYLPTRKQWNEIWRRFQTMNPTEEETRLFLALNPASKVYGGTEA